MTSIEELPPEILDAFYGPSPLLNARKHFPSREVLLKTYAAVQAKTFSPDTAAKDRCDLCHATATPHANLLVAWSARIRFHPGRIAILILLFPILIPLAMAHLAALLAHALKRFNVEDRYGFITTHPICKTCVRNLRIRRFFHSTLHFVTLFLGVIGIGASAITGSFILAALLGAWNFRPADAHEVLPWFLLAFGTATTAITLDKLLSRKILFPRTLLTLVKKPYSLMGVEVNRIPS